MSECRNSDVRRATKEKLEMCMTTAIKPHELRLWSCAVSLLVEIWSEFVALHCAILYLCMRCFAEEAASPSFKGYCERQNLNMQWEHTVRNCVS